jgi:putative transposase
MVTIKVTNMTTQLTTTREERGETIAQLSNQMQRVEDGFYTVKSQSGNGEYAVTMVDREWICECPDNKYRHVKCKHICAIEFSQRIRETVATKTIAPIQNLNTCVYCGSTHIVKDGVRKNKASNLQVFNCKDCHKDFTINIGFERMKHNPQAITSAMQLYFSGESLRNTMDSLKLLGVEVSHQTVSNWIKKYVTLMRNYVETFKPNVSDTWRADEIYIKVKGDMKYLFAMMDDETRYWIAQEVAETKDKHDARLLFHRAKRLMGKQPKVLITDGLPSYSIANNYVFCQSDNPKEHTKHIREITLKGAIHNNKMERMNGEIRDREKTMRGLKRKRTPILQGYQIFHNYIRPHETLNGKTPSEVCGIIIEGTNKWITLIQNASLRETHQHQNNFRGK